ncbi:hypothetical protein BH10ACT9_BH10ACT9_03980 [soil metagenome]
MTKFGILGTVTVALSAIVIGLAGPAQADDSEPGSGGRDRDSNFYGPDAGNNPWANQLVPTVKVPRVDTSVRN